MEEHLAQDMQRDFSVMQQHITPESMEPLLPHKPRITRKWIGLLRKGNSRKNLSDPTSNVMLSDMNIPRMMADVQFDRHELHDIYSRYKCLL
jgi:hypothetical protein